MRVHCCVRFIVDLSVVFACLSCRTPWWFMYIIPIDNQMVRITARRWMDTVHICACLHRRSTPGHLKSHVHVPMACGCLQMGSCVAMKVTGWCFYCLLDWKAGSVWCLKHSSSQGCSTISSTQVMSSWGRFEAILCCYSVVGMPSLSLNASNWQHAKWQN